jgi:hypothetical protein
MRINLLVILKKTTYVAISYMGKHLVRLVYSKKVFTENHSV